MRAGLEESTIAFDDGQAYEGLMGRWSRAAGAAFLDWLAPPRHADWLDVGCGTGAFTELVLDTCEPAGILGIDSSTAQVDFARNQPTGRRARFEVADAQMLPFPDSSFDVVAAALVVNFIPDVQRALGEMHRVGRPGGVVAAYVWDFAAHRAPNSSVAIGLRRIGVSLPSMPGTNYSRLDELRASFGRAGFEDIATRRFDITITFPNIEDFWRAQIPRFSPMAPMIATLAEADRVRLRDWVQTQLSCTPNGGVAYSARANAIRAHIPRADRLLDLADQ